MRVVNNAISTRLRGSELHPISVVNCIDWAERAGILRTQFLLHLYRFEVHELCDPTIVETELQRLTDRVVAADRSLPPNLTKGPRSNIVLKNTEVRPVETRLAVLLHEHCHYLGSPRHDLVHLGLFDNQEPDHDSELLSLITLSQLDVSYIQSRLPLGVLPAEVMVLSRQITMDYSPPNAFSHFMRKIRQWLRQNLPEIKMLITYVDPNLEFRGTSYKADNWLCFGNETKQRYLYLDSNFVTTRHMIDRYRSGDYIHLKNVFGARITCSAWKLLPLDIYAYPLARRLRGRQSDFQNRKATL